MNKYFFVEGIFTFLPKSHRKAGDGLASGKYPFFTSSQVQTKWFGEADYQTNGAIILGTGGAPSVHYAKHFSTSADVFTLASKGKDISTKYVYYFLIGHKDILERGFKGAGLKHLSRDYVQKIQIPIPVDTNGKPDLAEQERIVAVLEEAEKLKQKRAEADQKMSELIPALFAKMFGDREWDKVILSRISKVKIGPFGTQLHAKDYIKNGVPLVNPTHIIGSKITIDNELTVSESKADELNQYRMQTNDIVLARRGEMGRCGLVLEHENGFLCGTGSLFITPNEQVNPLYLQMIISLPTAKRWLEENAKGVTMKNLSIGIVEKLPISLPPISLQNQFAEAVKEIEVQKEKQKQSAMQIGSLFSSLLAKSYG